MRPLPALAPIAALFVVAAAAPDAHAFGGTAGNLEHKGNFVVTNNANFAFSHQLNSPTDTTFELRPALDYFIIDHLSIGGAVDFQDVAPEHGPSTTRFGVAPEVGYELALSDTISFWPTGAVSMFFSSDANPVVTLVITAPFLLHPAEHFFFGLGPGFSQDLTSNANTRLLGTFLIGGYFDH